MRYVIATWRLSGRLRPRDVTYFVVLVTLAVFALIGVETPVRTQGVLTPPPVDAFADRWWPGEGYPTEPLTFEERWAPVELLLAKRVRVIPITMVRVAAAEPVRAIAEAIKDPPVPRERPAIPAPAPMRDVCSRHGMHRVDYGKTWRCRR
jgi:hypothetical protein